MYDENDEVNGHPNYNNNHKNEVCGCNKCVCGVLSNILNQQLERKEENEACCSDSCYSQPMKIKSSFFNTIPFILQTPYGQPFFTWGKIGECDCFVTVFFKVIEVDCKNNCAVLELLMPNVSIIDPDTCCVETANICDVDFVIPTKECIQVDLSCFTAVKCISPEFLSEYM